MNLEVLFLGTGGSAGIPMIGCRCVVCSSLDRRDHRLRPSVLLTLRDKKILIDVGPDFRFQALKSKIDHLDGVLLTHSHFDHVAGLDELRAYYLLYRTVLPILVSATTLSDLKRRYDYLFKEKSWGMSLAAQLDFHVLPELRGEMAFLDFPIRYVTYEQGGMAVTGFRLGSFAYLSDIREYPETIFEDLQGVDVLVVSALGQKPSMMHFSIEEAIAFARASGARQTYFTHIGHDLGHQQTEAILPDGVNLAYDGLKVIL